MEYLKSKSFIQKYITFLFIVFFINSSFGQTWYQTYGGEEREEPVRAIPALDGGFLVLGYTESFGAGYRDMYVIKTDSEGEEEWSKTFGTEFLETSGDIIQRENGNSVIIGTIAINQFCTNMFITELNESGDMVWSDTIGGEAKCYTGEAILETSEGKLLAVGTFVTDSVFSAHLPDALFVSIDENRVIQHEKYYNYGADIGSKIHKSSDDETEYFLLGRSHEIDDPNLNHNLLSIKIDSIGNELWSKIYEADFREEAKGIISLEDGTYLLAGEVDTDLATDDYVLLIRINSDGDTLWTKQFTEGENGFYEEIGMINSNDGNILLTILSGSGHPYVAKLDYNGNLISNKTLTSLPTITEPVTIAPTLDDEYIITGTKSDEILGEGDIFLLKIGADELTTIDEFSESDIAAPTIFPNPASNEIGVVSNNELLTNYTYTCYDITGKLKLQGESKEGTINISLLPRGVYFLTIFSDENHFFTKKVIKK